MRGKRFGVLQRAHDFGITPADAGKTLIEYMGSDFAGDHPRGCGENPCLASRISTRLGSPPRMRGKPQAARSSARGTGITPADAGKTMPFAAAIFL